MKSKIFYFITFFLVISCVNLPNTQNDISNIQNKVPHKWRNVKASKNTIKIPDNWWILFKDDKLNKIVDTALANNKDVQLALINIQRELIKSGETVATMIPAFSADGSFKRTEQKNKSSSYSSGNFNVNYQIDLFGKLLNQYQAANLITRSTAEDAYTVGLTIVNQTIIKYWYLALLNEEISLYQEAVKDAQQILKIFKVRYKVGSISKMDYLNAQRFLIDQKYQLATIKKQKENEYTDLTVLLSLPPDTNLNIPNKLPKLKLPTVPVEYPLIVLANRPDVRRAQLLLQASLINIKVAVKNFYPNIEFNAGLSDASSKLKHLMENPVKSLALGFTLPVLQWPSNYLNFKLTKVNYAENLINFKYTLLNAVKEVENAFYNFNILENQYKLSKQTYLNNKNIEKAMKIRYEVGTESFDNYLQVKTNTISYHMQELNDRFAIYQAYITKILALGGSTRAQLKYSELKEKYD